MWNITYLITSDDPVGSLADIKGESVAVPFEGSVTHNIPAGIGAAGL